jgi:hypothetical protein
MFHAYSDHYAERISLACSLFIMMLPLLVGVYRRFRGHNRLHLQGPIHFSSATKTWNLTLGNVSDVTDFLFWSVDLIRIKNSLQFVFLCSLTSDLRAVKMSELFWVVTRRGLVGRFKHLEEHTVSIFRSVSVKTLKHRGKRFIWKPRSKNGYIFWIVLFTFFTRFIVTISPFYYKHFFQALLLWSLMFCGTAFITGSLFCSQASEPPLSVSSLTGLW